MISSFFIQNFRSILEMNLDFSYGERKAPNGYQEQKILPFIEAGEDHRIVPCTAFFGANASGKTNILKAFKTFKYLLEGEMKLSDAFEPNRLNPKFSETTFELEFLKNKNCFRYRITYDAKEIHEEILNKDGKDIYVIKNIKTKFSSELVSDSYPEKKLSDILRVECSDGEGHQTKLFLARIADGYPGLNQDLRNAFFFFKETPTPLLNNQVVILPVIVDFLAQTMKMDRAGALREITDVVRRLDIDIVATDIVEKEIAKDANTHAGIVRTDLDSGKKYLFSVMSTHKNVYGEFTQLDFFKHESEGTQRLAALVGLVLYSLRIGGVLFVDELESSLHPFLMREIVMLFKKRRHNPKGAQLIFTTHNTDILDDSILRLSEIALVRKTVANGTLVRRLVDVKNDGEDIRNVTNFRKQYLAGFYSGVPHPAL